MESPLSEMNYCYACKQYFPPTPEYFSRNKSKKDGLASPCKVCDKANRRAYAEAHREQESKNRKEYRDTHKELIYGQRKLSRARHKEAIAERKRRYQQQSAHHKAYQKRYQQAHKEELQSYAHQHYELHKEERLKRQKAYLQTAQGRMVDKAHRHKRKALIRASKGSYTSAQLQEQLFRQRSRCYYCKVKLSNQWHVDHIVPLSKHGTNYIWNIVIACPTCNLRKSSKLLHEWVEGGMLF